MLTLGVFAVIPHLPNAFAQPWLVREAPLLDLAVSLASFVLSQIVYAATVYASAKAASGDAPNAFASLRAALDRLGALLELAVRTFGSAFLLAITIAGIPLALRILVRWIFGTEAIMLRGSNAKGAISLSCMLATGRWWQLAGVILLFFLVIGLPNLTAPFLIDREVTVVGWMAASVLISPVVGCFWTLLFLDLEERTDIAQTAPMPVS